MLGADHWSDAPTLPLGSTSDPTPNAGLDNTGDPVLGWETFEKTAWWKITGFDGEIFLDISASTVPDPYMVVFVSDGSGGLTYWTDGGPDVSFRVNAGTTYYVQVGLFGGSTDVGDYVLSATVESYRALMTVSSAEVIQSVETTLVGGPSALNDIDDSYAEFGRYVWVPDDAGGGYARSESSIYKAYTAPLSLPEDASIFGVRAVLTGKSQVNNTGITLYITTNYSDYSITTDGDGLVSVNDITGGWESFFNFPDTTWQTRIFGTNPPWGTQFTAAEILAGGKAVWIASGAGVPPVDQEMYLTRIAFEVSYTSVTGPPPPPSSGGVGQLYVNLSHDQDSPNWVSVCPGEGGGSADPVPLYSVVRSVSSTPGAWEDYGAWKYSKSCQVYDGVMLTVSTTSYSGTGGRQARCARWSDSGAPELGPANYTTFASSGIPSQFQHEVQWLARLSDGIAIEFINSFRDTDTIPVANVWRVDADDLSVSTSQHIDISMTGTWRLTNNHLVVTQQEGRVVAVMLIDKPSVNERALVMVEVYLDGSGNVQSNQHVLIQGTGATVANSEWQPRGRCAAIVLHGNNLYRVGAPAYDEWSAPGAQWPYEIVRYSKSQGSAPSSGTRVALWTPSTAVDPVDDGVLFSGECYATLVGDNIDVVIPVGYTNQYNPYRVQRFDITAGSLGPMVTGDLFWDEYYGGAEVYTPITAVDASTSMVGAVGGLDTGRTESGSHGMPVRYFDGASLSAQMPGMGSWVPNLYHSEDGEIDEIDNFVLVSVGGGRVMAQASTGRWNGLSPAQLSQAFIAQIGAGGGGLGHWNTSTDPDSPNWVQIHLGGEVSGGGGSPYAFTCRPTTIDTSDFTGSVVGGGDALGDQNDSTYVYRNFEMFNWNLYGFYTKFPTGSIPTDPFPAEWTETVVSKLRVKARTHAPASGIAAILTAGNSFTGIGSYSSTVTSDTEIWYEWDVTDMTAWYMFTEGVRLVLAPMNTETDNEAITVYEVEYIYEYSTGETAPEPTGTVCYVNLGTDGSPEWWTCCSHMT